ncbi:MAG: O-antigen ligase family protein [Bacteroidia bacterium]|nr:O-antigen ligase family protein [Bacteroidia bacterium]
MIGRLLDRISPVAWQRLILALLLVTTVGAVCLALRLRTPLIMAIPIVLVVLLQVFYHYKPVFFLMMVAIPCSIQVELTPGFSMDMASEPFMLLFLLIFLFNLVSGKQLGAGSRVYTFHVLILLMMAWMLITTITSHDIARSFKFWVAKLWYIATFVYIAGHIIQSPADIRRIFWSFFVPLCLLVIGITIRHAGEQFSFESSNGIAYPLFANGVVYSATLVMMLAWAVMARTWYTPRSLEWYLVTVGIVILILGVIFSYKRGAWLAFLMLPGVYWLIRQRVYDKLLIAAAVAVALLAGYMVTNNNYYYYAPNYASTIWHGDDLSGHLEATFDGTEISSVERFYRWVAAKNMIQAMPVFGAGPSTFNQVYKEYADDAFRTYVSDNPEQSTTHNYFLMTFSEQGFPGGLIFITICLYMAVKGARLYTRISDPTHRSIVMLANLSLFSILFHSLLNELIEVDKIGPVFWLSLLIIHKSEVWHETTTGIQPA